MFYDIFQSLNIFISDNNIYYSVVVELVVSTIRSELGLAPGELTG